MIQTDANPPSPEFLTAFQRQAGVGGVMPFARFMELALYHPATGYYARRRRRIGREPDTDFFTATSLGPLFGELVAAAGADLLRPRPPGGYVFVEVGAERSTETIPWTPDHAPSSGIHSVDGVGACLQAIPPGQSRASSLPQPHKPGDDPQGGTGGVLAGVAHPFAAVASIALGQPLTLPPRAVVFSNELFDAQPCHRLVRQGGRWHEIGVALRGHTLEEIFLPDPSPEVRAVQDRLPAAAPEGYRIDLPLAAARLAAQIAAQPWTGLFVAFDYGKTWRELTEDTPAGTARAYVRHRQSSDLLAQPGEQDLTCHVCWDWLVEALLAHGFAAPVLESQEAFFVHHAAPVLSRLA
ncbi:MAG: SAM-dependent methyltransferase, partial [Opitutaceae bacterium]|nr:SAM-dependent methyltransferase [Opitutaceae bacterium]